MGALRDRFWELELEELSRAEWEALCDGCGFDSENRDTLFVFGDGMVKQWQDMQYEGRYAMSTYEDSLPDFVKLVESYGHVGRVVKSLVSVWIWVCSRARRVTRPNSLFTRR